MGSLTAISLVRFLDLSECEQLAMVNGFDTETLLELFTENKYRAERLGAVGEPHHKPGKTLAAVVVARMLERIAPRRGDDGAEGYDANAVDPVLRRRLAYVRSSAGRSRLRASVYESDLLPFLNSSEADQITVINSLHADELVSLLALVGRYARDRGRTPRTDGAKRLIMLRIPKGTPLEPNLGERIRRKDDGTSGNQDDDIG